MQEKTPEDQANQYQISQDHTVRRHNQLDCHLTQITTAPCIPGIVGSFGTFSS